MKKGIAITLLLACSIMACMAAVNSITGNWTTTMKPGDGSQFAVTYTFKADGDKFTGNVAFPNNNNFPITNGMIKGDSISFSVALNGQSIPNTGRVYADSIGLDIAMMGKKYHHRLVRAE